VKDLVGYLEVDLIPKPLVEKINEITNLHGSIIALRKPKIV
jgi:hypothetical protein